MRNLKVQQLTNNEKRSINGGSWIEDFFGSVIDRIKEKIQAAGF